MPLTPPPQHHLSFLGFCHCNVFDDEWPAHTFVSVLEKKDHVNIWKKKNENAAFGYESISENEWPSVCKFAQKTVPCREVPPYSNFPVVWFVTTFSF